MILLLTQLTVALAINSAISGGDSDACSKNSDSHTEIPSLGEIRKIEEELISLPRKFLAGESQCHDGSYRKFEERIEVLKEHYEALTKQINELVKGTDYSYSNIKHRMSCEYCAFFEKLRELAHSKYWKDCLLNHGIEFSYGNLGDTYRVFFEEEQNTVFEGKKIIRFRISPIDKLSSFCKDIKNAYVLLLNEREFEVYRFYIGSISKKIGAIGKFEIPETYYREFTGITMVGDTVAN